MTNQLAYGFWGQEALLSKRLTEVGTSVVWNMINMSVEEQNRQIAEMLKSFVERTTKHKERFRLPTSGTLQPLDEYGNPLPVKPGGYFDVAFPLRGGGTAFGVNRVTGKTMTVAEVNNLTIERLGEDANWMRRHMLAAVLHNAAWTFDDPEFGNLTIQPLANGDTVRYNLVGGSTATDNHYLAQANAISNTDNPFGTIYDELMEHPSNSGPVVVYVASSLTDSIEGLSDFVDVGDPDIRYGVNTDQIASPFSKGFGDEVLGKINKCWIVEWRALPDGYMIAHAQGAGPVLKMREYGVQSLQGLFTESNSPDGNLQETRFIRYAGFGVANRIGALVYQVGSATYNVPAGYSNPLSV